MQPQPRKGQTSLDFLMTYGWAVLLVVVVVASLFALGVFNAGSFLGPRATGFSQLDVVAWNIDSGGSLSLKLQNLAGMDVRVARIDASYGTSNYSFPITNVSIPNSKTSEVFTVGTISGLVPGQYYTLPMKITYMDFNGFNYTETGTISGNVGVGAPAPSLRINSPHSDDLLSNWTVNVSFTVAGANLSQADISIINSSGVIDSDSRSSPGTYTVQLSVSSDGVYDIAAIAYYNDGSNITAASTNITVNTTAPPPSGLQCGDPLDQEGHTYVLEDDVGSSGTCFAIGADNVTLDCDGHTITYAQAETGYGINITSHSNAIVRDCNIVQGNSSNNDSFGVYLFGGSIGNNIFDNNITTYGLDGVPIRLLSGCSNNYFGENILHSTQSHGIQFQSADYNTAWNNMIYVDGPSGNGIISMYSTGNNLTGNSIVTVGDNVIGISLSHESGDIVSGNTVSTNGSDSRGVYLEGSSESNTVISNNIITTSGAGTYLTGSTDNNFVSNNISSTSGPGVFFYGAADGNNFTSNIISSTNYFGAEISSTGGITFVNNSISSTNSIGVRMAYDGGINFTNNNISSTNSYGVQLISSSGSLFYDNIINGTTSVSSDGSSNSWNTALDCGTSNIVGGPCIGGNFWAQPDGNGWSQNASECNANSSGICTSNYTIDSNNVDELPLAPPISLFSCGNISYSGNYVLTSDVSDDGTCFTIEADYVTLDCAGHTVEYARGSAGYGVDITGYNFTTVKNCNIMQTNSSVASAHAVFLAGAMNSTIQDNSISTGGDGAFGVYLYWRSGSANNSFINNTIATTGAGSTGVFLQENEDGNLLSGNIISANGSNSAGISISACQNDTLTGNDITATGAGISLSGSSNSTVSDNTITTSAAGISLVSSPANDVSSNTISSTNGVGVYLEGSPDNTVSSNNISSVNNNSVWLSGVGVFLSQYSNSNALTNNTVSTSGGSAFSLLLYSSSNNTATGNALNTGGDGAFGVYLYWRSGSANNSFINNTIATTGAGSTGVFLQENEDGNLLSGNIISANGSNSAGISISACQNDTLTGNDITATGAGISLSGSSNSTVSDNTITSIGSYGVSLSSSSSSLFYDNIINGTTPVSSDGSPNLWNTALSCDVPGVANIVGGPCVGGNFWAQPDGNGWSENATECNANSSGICSSPYVIDGSNTDELPLAPLTPLFGCGNVSYSGYYVLTGDVSDDGTCFTIAADNVTLDCLGHMINYSQTTRGFGVNVTGRINATIRNCNIVQGSASFNASAVSLIGAGYSRITNNAITTIGNWSTAISVNSNNTFISYNTITIYGSNSSNGINMFTNAKNNTIESNNITMRGTFTSTAYAGRPVGINSGGPPTSFTALAMNTVRNNTVTLASTAMRNRGISVGNSANVTVANNTVVSYANDSAGINVGGIGHTVTGNSITIAADANFSYGINIGSANSSLFLANGITVSSTNSNGIAMGGNSTYNNISGNNITTTNDIATAVSLFSSSSNNTFSDNTIFTNGSNLEGISLYDSCNYNTFSDNTISTNVSNAGGISLYNNCNYNTLISNNITTGGNDAYGLFLGSSSNNNTFASNRITSSSSASIGLISSSGNLFYNNLFNGTTQADSTPNLWNTTLDCGTANIIGGACTGGNFWANSSDTGFSQTCSDTDVNGICDSIYDILGDGSNFDNLPLAAPPPPLSCGSAIYSNTTLASDITGCTGNGLYIGANDVTLDCAGHNITYGTASGWVNGINIGNYNHTTIRNCNIVQGGPNTNTNDNGIFLSSSTGNIIYNNTITVIGNGSNGISIWIYSSNSTIADNAVTATGNGSNAIAMWNSTNIAVINNTVITTGNSDSAIGMMWNSTNAIISNNTIATFGLSSPGINMPNGANLSAFGNNVTTIGASSHGIVVLSSPDNNITSNNISVSGTNSFGIFDYMGSNNTRILDNRINTTGFTGLGILVHSSSNATVWNNTVSTTNNGSSAISFSNATGGLASYNTVDTYGANSSHGIAMGIAINSATTPSRNVTVEWNTVTVHGDSSPSDVTNPVACIMAAGADYNTIQNNNLTAAGAKDSGIQASYHSSFPTSTSANNITITDNTITLTGTNATGFRFMVGTNHTVTGNTVIAAGSLSNGLLLNKTNSSTFDSNKINAAGSGYGIRATSSSGNLIYNNIINGTASSDTNVNTWNVTLSCSGPQNIIGGSCIGGNYWANATGDGWSETCTDTTPADGVCDTGNEYLIPNSNDYDYLPLH